MKLPRTIASVRDVQIMNVEGPWNTKSRATLMLICSLPFFDMQSRYFRYRPEELKEIQRDIRGLRIYTVRGIRKGAVGGQEWHRIREEIVFVLEGSFTFICEDLHGAKREFALDPRRGLRIPSFILHTYRAQKSKSGLIVLANTMYEPKDPNTHDTYSAEIFYSLIKK